MSPAELAAYADALVAGWPPLTPEQIDDIAALLRPALRAA